MRKCYFCYSVVREKKLYNLETKTGREGMHRFVEQAIKGSKYKVYAAFGDILPSHH